MKVIHCADIHLDSKLTANMDREKAFQRNMEILDTFSKMVEFAKTNKVKVIIIAGDLFDTDNISNNTRKVVLGCILKNSNIEFYYLKGNHDLSELILRGEEKPPNLNLFSSEKLKTYRMLLKNGKCITVSGLEINSNNKNLLYDRLNLKTEEFNIVILHGQINEYKTDSEENIALSGLYNKNIDYLALGHIHRFIKGELKPRGIYCYSGCLETRGFDEAGEHGFVMLDIDEESFEYKLKFIPFAKRKIVNVDITDVNDIENVDNLLFEIADRFRKNGGVFGDILDLTMSTDTNISYLEKLLKDEYYIVKIRLKRIETYNEYTAENSMIAEFINVVKLDKDLTDEKKEEIIKCGVKLLKGEKTDFEDKAYTY